MLLNLVRVQCGTTGTGTMTLGAAVSGFLTMAQAGGTDQMVVFYGIECSYVTSGNVQVATQREVGYGTWTSGTNTLTRNVVNSTNSNAAISLPGDAQVIILAIASSLRDRLPSTATRTYFVNGSAGSDSNSGFTSGKAFATITKAVNVLTSDVDVADGNVAVSVADGTYNEDVNLFDPCNIYPNGFSITGNTATPSNVVVDGGWFINSVSWNLKGMKFQRTAGGDVFNCDIGSILGLRNGIVFGATSSGAHIDAHNGAIVYIATNYTISGGADTHWNAESNALVRCRSVTITTSGTPAFSTAFAYQSSGGVYQTDGITFAGTGATGKRYLGAGGGGGFWTGTGGNVNYYPGSIAGTVQDGSTYDGIQTAVFLPPATLTNATYTVLTSDYALIANRAGTVTLTLPTASGCPGRSLAVKTIQNQTVVSAASDVVPLAGGGAGTAILSGTAGRWAIMQSDGSNWIITQGVT